MLLPNSSSPQTTLRKTARPYPYEVSAPTEYELRCMVEQAASWKAHKEAPALHATLRWGTDQAGVSLGARITALETISLQRELTQFRV